MTEIDVVSTSHLVAVCLPIIGLAVFIALGVLTIDTWYPFVFAVIFSPILLCMAVAGMIIAVNLPSLSGLPQVLKILALIINGIILAPFAAWLGWLAMRPK
jgi:hypothetical protein